jgi:hypothetical protein
MGDIFNNFSIVVTEHLNLHDVEQEVYYFQKNFFLGISRA